MFIQTVMNFSWGSSEHHMHHNQYFQFKFHSILNLLIFHFCRPFIWNYYIWQQIYTHGMRLAVLQNITFLWCQNITFFMVSKESISYFRHICGGFFWFFLMCILFFFNVYIVSKHEHVEGDSILLSDHWCVHLGGACMMKSTAHKRSHWGTPSFIHIDLPLIVLIKRNDIACKMGVFSY